jgi:hypothetical protein
MTFTLGIFELFTYAIPGGMQLIVLIYVAARLKIVDMTQIAEVPGAFQLILAITASYLLGHLTYLVGLLVDRVTTFKYRSDALDAWEAVSAKAGDSSGVPKMNVMLLLARIQLTHREAAAEISRFRASGLMLRNATVPTACALLIALVEVITGPMSLFATVCAALFALMIFGFAKFGAQMRYWANTKTFEFAYWTGAGCPVSESNPPNAQNTERRDTSST